MKYLVIKLTNNKNEQIKNIKKTIKNNVLRLIKFNFTLPTTPSVIMKQALYKSLAFYHFDPAIMEK